MTPQDLELHPRVASCSADDVPPPTVAVLGPRGRDAAGPSQVQGLPEPGQEPGQARQGSFAGLGEEFFFLLLLRVITRFDVQYIYSSGVSFIGFIGRCVGFIGCFADWLATSLIGWLLSLID